MHNESDFKQAIFINYRTAFNLPLEMLGYGWAEYPWEAITQLHNDWLTTKSIKRKQQLEVAMSAMRMWKAWLIELGNTVIPDYPEDEDVWYPD